MSAEPGEYRVAVPSYRRARMLEERTLPFLLRGGVPPERVTVFVHDHDEQNEDYRLVAKRHGVGLVSTSARGINAQREAILHSYDPGTSLVQADDDVLAIMEAVDAKTLREVRDVDGFLAGMFRELRERGLYVWGLAPVPNAFYMKPGQLSERLKFLIFALWGCFTRPGHPVHDSTVPTKDDYELSLRAWFYDGAVLRHDGAAVKADIYKAPGGCQDTRTVEQAQASVDGLMAQWPGLVRLNTRRKSQYPEIVLASKKRHAGNSPDTLPPGVGR